MSKTKKIVNMLADDTAAPAAVEAWERRMEREQTRWEGARREKLRRPLPVKDVTSSPSRRVLSSCVAQRWSSPNPTAWILGDGGSIRSCPRRRVKGETPTTPMRMGSQPDDVRSRQRSVGK